MPEIITEELQQVAIDAIREHPANPRTGNVNAIRESIRKNGFYGALVVQKSSGHILAGNHRWKAAKQEDFDTIPVLYAHVSDEQAMRILLADNRTNDLAGYDDDSLADLLEHLASTEDELAGTGYTDNDLDSLLQDLDRLPNDAEDNAQKYSSKIETPTYEPREEEPPPVADLCDREKTRALIADIERSDLPSELANFLIAAAHRHTIFDFRKIAEYYAHAEPDVQDLMEASALVIVDFNRAIEDGFVHLSKEMQKAVAQDDDFEADPPDHEA